MNAACRRRSAGSPAGVRLRPKPGASHATARRRVPTAASSGSQSALEPGLPCTKTTASDAPAGPASRSGVPVPPQRSSPWRTPATGSSQPPGRGPRSTRSAVAGRSTCCGGSRMPTTATNAPATDGVVLGDRAQPAQVAVDGAHRQRSVPGHVRQRQVGAGGKPPGVIDGGLRGRQEPPREIALARCQAVAQRHRLGSRHGHALAVHGIERAQRVAAHQQPRGKRAGSGGGRRPGRRAWRSRPAAARREIASPTSGGATVRANASQPLVALAAGGRARIRRAWRAIARPPGRTGTASAEAPGAARRAPACRRRARRAGSRSRREA